MYNDDANFFNFDCDMSTCSNASDTIQAAQYMENQSRDLQSLKRYPVVMDMFLRYNTVIPSSAAVERLFSAGGKIMIPHRNGLSDGSFDKLLLLRQNILA